MVYAKGKKHYPAHRSYRRTRFRVRKVREIGLVPAILGSLTAAVPFFSENDWGNTPFSNLIAAAQGDMAQLEGIGPSLISATKNGIPDMVALGTLAAIFGYVGKKVKIPITKKLKVF